MRVFTCSACHHELDFESMACPHCERPVGYLPDRREMVVLVPGESAKYAIAGDDGDDEGPQWRCLNAAWGCNWTLPADAGDVWCLSCRLTRGRPDEADPAAIAAWSAAEAAKRRLVFQIGELGLPIEPRSEVAPEGLAFDLVHVPGAPGVTGHDRGLITLDLSEADERHRDDLRRRLGEPYRTLIGHLRHEVGHYYFARLIGQSDHIAEFRKLFGDERVDYPAALDEHYRDSGSGTTDLGTHVTAYAASHPLEDWAETFAHYLHVRDAQQTADSRGLHVGGGDTPARRSGRSGRSGRSSGTPSFASIMERWQPVIEAINQIADGLGSPRPYPFTLGPSVVTKLEFVHARVTALSDREDFYAAQR
ncbi:MAG: putative zinc-binding metallopeptidase [Ilumatobacteraceae bacterium]